MAKHEHFENLCSAASVGEATGAELAELQLHFAECADCRQVYSDFLELGAIRCATSAGERPLSGEEAVGYIDSALFRERFLKKAEAEGIVFSRGTATLSGRKLVDQTTRKVWYSKSRLAAAASVFLALGGVGGYEMHHSRGSVIAPMGVVPRSVTPPPVPAIAADRNSEDSILHLEATNRRLTAEIATLRATLDHDASTINRLQATAGVSEKERVSLATTAQERDSQIAKLRQQLVQIQGEAERVRSELAAAQESNQATMIADQVKIRDISDRFAEQTAALQREREMLSANRDIRDLIAARNLHIADVFDTDSKGKTRAAFGRVFFTEGKSLIIYAYDLNDQRVQDAGYHYRVWGKKEGPGQTARSLGMFYSDDKEQKRWVFKYDDPKVLSEIDSVFVTLEPPGKTSTEPKGEKFLYAYLRNEANHP